MDTDGQDKSTDNTNADGSQGDKAPPTITAEQFAEMSAATKRLEAQNKKLSEDYTAAQKRIAEVEKAKLEGSGDFKKLWETERDARAELEGKLAETKSSFVLTQKHFAAKEALLKAGLDPGALKMLDKETFDSLEVEIKNDRFEVRGAETLVTQWKQEYPFLFKAAAKAPNVNTGGTGHSGFTGTGEVTADELFKIERKFGGRSKEYTEAAMKFAENKAKNRSANR